MQRTVIATVIVLSAGLAFAQPHDFQQQIGSSELDPSIWEGPELTARPFQPSASIPSLIALYHDADIDGAGSTGFAGTPVPSGPSRISLYEVYRGSPEGFGYSDYFERFPAGTDWVEVARAHRAGSDGV